jgi:beta-lactamase regulating signal transducer with metallopeptidase domain
MKGASQLLLVTDWLAVAIQVAIAGTIVSAVVLMITRLVRPQSDPFRHGILFAGVIALLILPALVTVGNSLPSNLFSTPVPEEEVVRIPAERLSELLEPRRPDVAGTEGGVPPGTVVALILCLAWAVGIAAGLVRLLRSLWKQCRTFPGQAWQPEFWNETYQTHLAKRVGLRKFPDVLVSPAVPMPMVVGLWSPKIVLPEAFPGSWCQAQWEAVLRHEAAHIARRDQWAVLAQALAVILFWWCPLVHRLSRRLNELRENICDDYALQGPCDGITYAALLVETAERLLDQRIVPVPLGLLDSARRGLEARVTRLLDKERRPMSRLTWPGKLLGAAFLAAACLLTVGAAAFSQSAPQPPKKVQIKIIVDGKEFDLNDERIQALLGTEQKKNPSPKVRTVERKLELVPENPRAVEVKTDIWTVAPENPKIKLEPRFRNLVTQAEVTLNSTEDPRIEALVKQAEAIKPGSGDAVRKALQAKQPAPKTKWLELRPEVKVTVEGKDTATKTKGSEPKRSDDVIIWQKVPDKGTKPAAKTSAAPDVEALRQQVERLSAELDALRKRLDAQKK